MARPTKYTPTLTERIKQYISDGLTVRDICYGVGISEDTFCRWRREKPEFAKLVQEATEAQSWSSISLARTSEYRRYQRRSRKLQKPPEGPKGSDIHPEVQNGPEMVLNTSRRQISKSVDANCSTKGLETRSEPPVDDFGELVCCEPYYNSTTNKIEWAEKVTLGKPVLHRCSLEKWQE